MDYVKRVRSLEERISIESEECIDRLTRLANGNMLSSLSKTVDELSIHNSKFKGAKSGALLIDELEDDNLVPSELMLIIIRRMNSVLKEIEQ